MTLYYTRISTALQNPGRQLEMFRNHGQLNSENSFIDKIQGNVPFFERPEALRLFETAKEAKENVTVCIESIDRLGRNLIDILRTIEVFTRNRINLKSLKEGFETLVNGEENQMAKIVIGVMGSIAELERTKIKERQSEGIKLAKANGKYKGRRLGSKQTKERLLTKYALIVQKIRKDMTIQDIADVTKRSPATVLKVKKALAA